MSLPEVQAALPLSLQVFCERKQAWVEVCRAGSSWHLRKIVTALREPGMQMRLVHLSGRHAGMERLL